MQTGTLSFKTSVDLCSKYHTASKSFPWVMHTSHAVTFVAMETAMVIKTVTVYFAMSHIPRHIPLSDCLLYLYPITYGGHVRVCVQYSVMEAIGWQNIRTNFHCLSSVSKDRAPLSQGCHCANRTGLGTACVANRPVSPGNTIGRHPRATHANTVTATNRINQQRRALIVHNIMHI